MSLNTRKKSRNERRGNTEVQHALIKIQLRVYSWYRYLCSHVCTDPRLLKVVGGGGGVTRHKCFTGSLYAQQCEVLGWKEVVAEKRKSLRAEKTFVHLQTTFKVFYFGGDDSSKKMFILLFLGTIRRLKTFFLSFCPRRYRKYIKRCTNGSPSASFFIFLRRQGTITRNQPNAKPSKVTRGRAQSIESTHNTGIRESEEHSFSVVCP